MQACVTCQTQPVQRRKELAIPDDRKVGPLLDFWWRCWPQIDCAVTCWARPSERLVSQPRHMVIRPAHWMLLALVPLNVITILESHCTCIVSSSTTLLAEDGPVHLVFEGV